MISPLHRCISHTEVDLGSLLEVTVASFLSYLHGTVEVLGGGIIVALLCQELTQLKVSARFTLAVLQLV